MKTFKDFLNESKYLKEETADERYDRITRENESIFNEMNDVKYNMEELFYKLKNGLSYGSHKIKPLASQIEKYCKDLISLSKKLKEPN